MSSTQRKLKRESKTGKQSIFLERRNAYFCPDCYHTTVTVDVDEGVTPMFIACGNCGKTAGSFMYQLPGCIALPSGQMGGTDATHEWYKPNEEELKDKTPAEQDHVKQGGLLLRLRTDAKAIRTQVR